jgi:hypothetical protein
MKLFTPIAAASIILSCILLSCNKHNDTPNPPTPPPSITGSISISTPVDTAMELIVSETGGKILLDSVFTAKGVLSITLHTNDALVDVTTITRLAGIDDYLAFTYKAVNPSGWTTVEPGSYFVPVTALPYTNDTITYTDAPNIAGSVAGEWVFSDFTEESSYSFSYSPGGINFPSTLVSNYQHHGSNPAYILFPASGQYNFHTQVNTHDTVDLLHTDTAIMAKFSRPAEYQIIQNCSLVGYKDTTDFSKSTLLYAQGPQLHFEVADVEYPRQAMQTYQLDVSMSNSNNGVASYYSYGNSVPTDLPLQDESAYNLSSSQFGNFSVNFLSAKPSYYNSVWQAGKVYWTLYASPDSTMLHPQTLLTSLKSKFLQGQDLTSLSLFSFSFEKALGLDYAGYFSYTANPAVAKSKRLASSTVFTKTF